MMNFDAFFRCCVAVLVLFVERIEMYISKAEEIENAVKSDGRDGLLRVGFYFRFGVESDAQTCQIEHWQIVGTISYGDNLL